MARSHRLSSPQRAAALLVALGPSAASRLLSYLEESEVEALTAEVAGLSPLPVETVDEIVEDLRRQASRRPSAVEGGMAYARKLLESWGPKGEAILERVAGTPGAPEPFRFLVAVPPTDIVRALADEHPQTAAVVITQLAEVDAGHAGTVLSQLDESRRGDVAGRIARLRPVSAEIVRGLEHALAPRFVVADEAGPVQTQERDGPRDLAAILKSVDRDTEAAILAALEGVDSGLFGRVRSLLFIFDDLIGLGDRDLQEALRAVDAPTLALALKGAESDIRDAIMRNLSERARTAIVEEMEILGLVRRADVEEARTKVVDAVRKLEEEGKIVLRQEAEGGMVG